MAEFQILRDKAKLLVEEIQTFQKKIIVCSLSDMTLEAACDKMASAILLLGQVKEHDLQLL